MSNNVDKWQRGGKIESIQNKKNKKNKKNDNGNTINNNNNTINNDNTINNNGNDRRINNKYNNDKRDNRYNNDRRDNRYNNDRRNNRYNKQQRQQQEDNVIQLVPQVLLPQVEEKKYEPIDTKYKNIVDNTIESEKTPTIDVNDPNNWNRHKWVGPVLRKMEKPNSNYSNYLKEATKYASTIVMPFSKIQCSRDGINWYNSYKETFTENEWNNMLQQDLDELNEKYYKKIENKYNKELQEAYEEYYETGDMNTMVQVDIEAKEHEKYLERLEKEIQDYQDENDFDDDEEF